MSEERVELRVYLRAKGKIVQQFDDVKEYLGVTNDTEVLRFLIADFWRNLKRRGSLRREQVRHNHTGEKHE
jgi:hypothetical protein